METPFVGFQHELSSNEITINNNANINANKQPQAKRNNNKINHKNHANARRVENTNGMILTNAALS